MKNFIKKNDFKKIIFPILIFISYISFVYWVDVIWDYIKTQQAIWTWTNNNKITFSRIKTTYYINKDNDNNLTWDQLRWFYYDNIYWYFRLDWSDDLDKNVHISSNSPITITWKCNKAWKFSWKAYSKYVWYINFNYDSNYYVYYCEDDWKLYWYAYDDNLGSQPMNEIKININNQNQEIQNIDDINNYTQDNRVIKENTIDSTIRNYRDYNIGGWDWYEIENTSSWNVINDNIFWIVK